MTDNSVTTKLINETTARQMRAATPDLSAWVSANAGSGKTHVLSQRVVRLLINGTPPSAILCLTYTKAAAAEMSLRIFKILSDWAKLDDEALRAKISELENRPPSNAMLLYARRLFASALETPGGLKIQTIHAFCEAILHRFPLEANVAGHFEVLDDKSALEILDQSRKILIDQSVSESNSCLSNSVSAILSAAGDQGFDQLISQIIKNRSYLPAIVGDQPNQILRSKLAGLLHLDESNTEEDLIEGAWPIPAINDELIELYCELAFSGKNKTPKDVAQYLKAVGAEKDPNTKFEILKSGFLTKAGKPRGMSKAVNADLVEAIPNIEEMLNSISLHVLDIEDQLKRKKCLDITEHALIVGQHLIETFEAIKRRRAMLDYDDLIIQTANLFRRQGAGSWVHYKLDKGIDHILIDEAQDTSPDQWNVVQSLASEFYSGASAREIERTMFAVGDEKQSIYSFQGAQPERFDRERRETSKKATKAEKQFDSIPLRVSFRSAPDILRMVDLVFEDETSRKGLSFSGEAIIHETVRQAAPGRVELWEMLTKQKQEQSDDWLAPFDSVSETDPINILAQQISQTLDSWIGKELIEDQKTGKPRLIAAGDVLVLVRKRDAFVPTLIRTLKSETDIPVAGTDRLRLTDHIAVQDLIALGKVLLLKEDDLALAGLLKSPFFNVTEEQLFELCAKRNKTSSVWDNLCQSAEAEGPWRDILEQITQLDWLSQRLSVHDFFQHVLGPFGGRQIYLDRMGNEVSDVLDGFLDAALDHDMNGLPGLQSFIYDLENSSLEIKREQEHGVDAVRIMTVHASKGLEAPIVFLVDPGSAAFHTSHASTFRKVTDDEDPQNPPKGFLWVPNGKFENSISTSFKERQAELAEEEYKRLLYVGMTRAADRLIVCGYRGSRESQKPTWHKLVSNGFARAGAETKRRYEREISHLRWSVEEYSQNFRDLNPDDLEVSESKPDVLMRPTCLDTPLEPDNALPRPLVPSGTHAIIEDEYAKPLQQSPFSKPENSITDAIQYGKSIHRLLQVIPNLNSDEWQTQSLNYLKNALPDYDIGILHAVADNIIALLNDARFSPIFHGSGASEFSVMGTLDIGGEDRLVSGRIDRMAVLEDKVLVVDYKTNSNPPDSLSQVPKTYINQMAIYRAVLQPLYPNKKIHAALLYTRAPRLIEISDHFMDAALAEIRSK